MNTTSPDQYDRISSEFDTIFESFPQLERKFLRRDKSEMIAREFRFIAKISQATQALHPNDDRPAAVLFDIDETLLKNNYDTDNSVLTVIRPGIALLVEQLDESYETNINYGLLSSRSQQHLDAEVLDRTYSTAFGNKLDPKFVISSRDSSFVREHWGWEYANNIQNPTDGLDALRYIIDPRIATALTEGDRDSFNTLVERGHWFDNKLAILALTAQAHPDTAFVFVDDLPFANVIDPNHAQVRGVALGDAAFYL